MFRGEMMYPGSSFNVDGSETRIENNLKIGKQERRKKKKVQYPRKKKSIPKSPVRRIFVAL